MPTLKNVNPLGAVEVPLLGRVVEADEEFEVTADQAKALAATKSDNYELVTDKTAKKKD